MKEKEEKDQEISSVVQAHFRMNDTNDVSRAMEDYLRLIFELSGEAEGLQVRVSTSRIAKALNIRPASVTAMLQKMAEASPALVDYRKHQGVLFTSHGRKAALAVIRNHRLLELFLYRIMGFPWEQVHGEALRLQHAISPEFTRRMAELLEHPCFDPHGAPIPDENLNLTLPQTMRMTQIKEGSLVRVASVPDDNPDLLKKFRKDGLIPGAVCKILQKSEDLESVECRIQSIPQEIILKRKIAETITVEKLGESEQPE